MISESQSNQALVEIALALAMAFFVMMLLSMVMVSRNPAHCPGAQASPPATVEESLSNHRQRVGPPPDDQILLYFSGRFYNTQLQPVDPETLSTESELVLALPKSSSIEEAMQARSRILSSDLVITSLTEDWLRRLESL